MSKDWRYLSDECYSEPWRYHHTNSHVNMMWDKMQEILRDEEKKGNITKDEHMAMWNVLNRAIVFHDIVYEPFASDNEEKSVELWREYVKEHCTSHYGGADTCQYTDKEIEEVASLIMSTKHPENAKTKNELILRDLDWNYMGSTHDITPEYAEWLDTYENNIFKEFQKVPVEEYVKHRLIFIDNSVRKGLMTQEVANYLRPLVQRKRTVGIYAGSFYPFHNGHLNIVRKAEKMFDKVIIAKGYNRAKKDLLGNPEFDNVKDIMRHHEVIEFPEQLVEFVNSKRSKYVEPVLVRGLRNGYDMDDEDNLVQFLDDMSERRDAPKLNIAYIHCDKKYEHIASHSIRVLDVKEDRDMYIPDPQ